MHIPPRFRGKRFAFIALASAMLLIPLIALATAAFERPPSPPAEKQTIFTLPDLLNPDRSLSYPIESTPQIVHVFASWCASCAVEHPLLMDLHKKYGIKFYGIAWRDTAQKAKAFLENHGNPYISVGLDGTGDAAAFLLDVTGTPETLVLDAQGQVLYRQRGPLTPDIMRDMIAPLLVQ